MEPKPRAKFIREVGKIGLNFEDLSYIVGIDFSVLYRFAAGKLDLTRGQENRLAAILDQNPDELFEYNKVEK
jgi:hypothetical protein